MPFIKAIFYFWGLVWTFIKKGHAWGGAFSHLDKKNNNCVLFHGGSKTRMYADNMLKTILPRKQKSKAAKPVHNFTEGIFPRVVFGVFMSLWCFQGGFALVLVW